MKKILLSGFVIIVFLAYAYHQKTENESVVVTPKSSLNSSASNNSTSGLSNSSIPPSSSISYKDGTYTGSVADAFYGNIQVKAIISNGKISDVQFLQYPNDRRDSVEINTQAMPYLKQEAIQAQTASVQIVSGATQSSEAFNQSLKSALDQAKS